jgi:RHS repeat-associated protein
LGYNKASYMNKVISPNKHPWVLTPNGAGLPGLVEDPLNNKDEYKYYQDGLLKELTATETGGRSLTHNLKYNALGDLWRAGDTFRGLDTYKYEYKPVNKMLEISEDPGGGSVSYDYDGLNRISHVTRKIEYEGYIRDAVTQYKYTPNGQLEKIFDDAGNFTHYVYDSKDRLKDIYYPEEVGSMHFTYTKNDQIKTSTDLNGTLLTNKYDAAGRLETRTILPGQDVVGTTSETFGYDELGRLHTAGNEDTLVTFDYNTAGRLYQETQELKDSEGNITATYVVGYEYDDNGNLTNLTYPSNIDPSNPASSPKKVVYTPDELDRIDIITSGGKTIADYDYEGKIKISDKKLFNGTLLMKSIFDDGRRPESLTYKSGGNVLFDRGMTWNLMDMKLSETGPGIDKVYTYDTAWRLKTEINKSDKYIKDYSELTIDEDENLEQIRSLKNGKSLVSLECKHENKRHQLTGVDYSNLVDNKVVKFHVVPFYDKNGNMKSFVHQYKYDYKNQLVEVVTGTGLNVEYKYDALGRRTEKIVSAPGGNKVTRYVNAGWRVLEERDGNNALLKRYTYGNGIDEQVAQEYKTNNGLVTVLPMYDSTGNMIGITDDTGKLIEKYSYSVFGLPEFDYDSAAPVIKTVHVIDGKVITGFSEPVNIGTVANGMKVKHEGTVIPGTIEPGAGGKEIKFIPSTPLQPGQMSVDLAETVEDEAGNQMGSPFSNTFMYSGTPTIVHDESAPEVDSIKKDLDGFKITFSERIDEATTTSSIEIKKADGTISGSITTIDERTFKFTPDEMLTANQEYTLWVYSTLKDLSGKSINQFFHSFMLLPDDFLVYEKPDPNKHVYSRIGNNYLFHGREYEPEVGLYYYRHRYYMPRIGRFLQTDPMQYQDSMNLYQAFGMNPINFTDPFGLIDEYGIGHYDKGEFAKVLTGEISTENDPVVQAMASFSRNVFTGIALGIVYAYSAPVAISIGGFLLLKSYGDSLNARLDAGQTWEESKIGTIVDFATLGGYTPITGWDAGTGDAVQVTPEHWGNFTGTVVGIFSGYKVYKTMTTPVEAPMIRVNLLKPKFSGKLLDIRKTQNGVIIVSESSGQTTPSFESFFGKIIDMSEAPDSSAITALGFKRNATWFWRQMLKNYPEMFSLKNQRLIKQGRSPIIDETWIEFNEAYKIFPDNKLIHHHIYQGNYATPIPEQLHLELYKILHQQKKGGKN